ncbi:HopJ type III effector protein [Endozoicomonas sp. Mp262]|uniref:HopJ type III effector protein n=1 Tax=Endozoicomonas sp. Mp262 TaxID=2919499 RepID=UPI0021E02A75
MNGRDKLRQVNEAGTNEGSCKIFAFGKIHNLTQEETLACFGRFYREDVINDHHGQGHGNIRAFIVSGWDGITFDHQALIEK